MNDNATIKILDIGCGGQKVEGAIGIDFNSDLSADVVHDLNLFPYPFVDNEFDKVYIKSTMFLLDNPVRVMEEVYRICKKGSIIIIVQPYFRSVWNYVDPWVKNFGTVHSFSFYDPNDLICQRYQYSVARFETVAISFDEYINKPSIVRSLLIKLANKFPRKYEIYLSHIFPLNQITHKLKKI